MSIEANGCTGYVTDLVGALKNLDFRWTFPFPQELDLGRRDLHASSLRLQPCDNELPRHAIHVDRGARAEHAGAHGDLEGILVLGPADIFDVMPDERQTFSARLLEGRSEDRDLGLDVVGSDSRGDYQEERALRQTPSTSAQIGKEVGACAWFGNV